MSRPPRDAPLDAALDAALDALAAGGSVEDCLAAWPQHRAALEPALRAATHARALHLPASPPDPARRAAFMAQLHATPQLTPRSRGAALRAAVQAFAALGRRGLVLAPAAAIVAAALFVTLGRSAPPAEASTLTIFAGAVERADGAGWRPLADNAQLSEGARLRTSAAGRAVLTFEDGSTVALEPDTELTIERLRTAGARAIALRLAYGRLWHDVAAAPDRDASASYLVRTPDATVSARGTLFETAVTGGETTVATLEGSVELTRDGARQLVQRGQLARAQLHRPLAPPEQQQPFALAIAIDAPFVAALVAPDGRATGARLDGLRYHQISGATSSDPGSGEQRIALAHAAPGVYTLLLGRTAPGEGALVLTAADGERRVPLDPTLDALALRLQIEQRDGRTVVTPLRIAAAADTPLERLVVPERARLRAAVLLRERAAQREQQREQGDARATPPPADARATPPSARPTIGPRPAAAPTRTLPTPPRSRDPLAPATRPTRAPASVGPERTPTPAPTR